MSEVKNELARYITDSLKNNYRKTSVLKESNESSIYIFTHKKTGQKIVERISKTEMMTHLEQLETEKSLISRQFMKSVLLKIL